MVDLLPSFDAIPLFPKKKEDSARFKSESVTKKKEFQKSQKVHLITQ